MGANPNGKFAYKNNKVRNIESLYTGTYQNPDTITTINAYAKTRTMDVKLVDDDGTITTQLLALGVPSSSFCEGTCGSDTTNCCEGKHDALFTTSFAKVAPGVYTVSIFASGILYPDLQDVGFFFGAASSTTHLIKVVPILPVVSPDTMTFTVSGFASGAPSDEAFIDKILHVVAYFKNVYA